jgi:hypothetical protein
MPLGNLCSDERIIPKWILKPTRWKSVPYVDWILLVQNVD